MTHCQIDIYQIINIKISTGISITIFFIQKGEPGNQGPAGKVRAKFSLNKCHEKNCSYIDAELSQIQ